MSWNKTIAQSKAGVVRRYPVEGSFAQFHSLSDELLIELGRIDPATRTSSGNAIGKGGPSETSGRQQSVYRLGVERIDGLLERLAIEGGSHCEWLTVLSR